jgi:hypothetical protein
MTNLAEIINRLTHYANHELPLAQATDLRAEILKRHQQLAHIVGTNALGPFTISLQHLDACRHLTTQVHQRLTDCQKAVLEATHALR